MDEHQIANAPQGPGYIVLEEARKVSEADRWTTLPELGTPASLRVIAWIAAHIGRTAARLLLYPITAYFVITAQTARRTSYQYLTRVRGRSARWWHVFRHFHCFGATILDRVYLLRGKFEGFASQFMGRKAWTATLKAAEAAYC